jgi:hypothetical protein
MGSLCMTGSFRRVWLTRRYAVKAPLVRNLIAGMRCNRWEREMWRVWRPRFPSWTNLCPIAFADPFGFIVVMNRANQPVTINEIEAEDPDCYPDIDCEFGKPDNFGRFEGRIVAVDYGLSDIAHVRERRAYLASKVVTGV